MDAEKFEAARAKVLTGGRETGGIGTLSEKTLHAVLKEYYSEGPDEREVKIGRYVADIVGEHGIVEIQTGSFDRLQGKLLAFLDCARVTVVYPVAGIKWVSRIDRETGELLSRRKSPKKGSVFDAFSELCKIRTMLGDPRLTLRVAVLEVEEYRVDTGQRRGRRKRTQIQRERVPVRMLEEYVFENLGDYAHLLPESLPVPFTSKELSGEIPLPASDARLILYVLAAMGVVRRVGKKGNAYLYEQVYQT